MISRDTRVNVLIGNGHFLSHFYILTLPPLFLFIQKDFDVSYAELGLVPVVMSAMGAIMQTPYGFLVDRFGARRFLVMNTLVMGISVSLMGVSTAYWQIIVLAGISGLANAVYHPADYTILSASIRQEKMGQAFAIHTFTGNAGFALAPPVVALLASFFGWREALVIVGLVSVPVAAAIVWQSSIISDVASQKKKTTQGMTLSSLIFDRTLVLFFFFYLLGSAAGSGVQAWLITILHQVKGVPLELASAGLTAYMVGTMSGIIFGGWVVDRSKRYVMILVAGLTGASSILTFIVGITPVTGAAAIVLMFLSGLGLGGSRTPRDIMLKDAVPPSEIGKVFGFVSSGLALGSAITPVPFGYLIDNGYGDWVLVIASIILVASIFCMGTARASGKSQAALDAEAAEAAAGAAE
ncbi:MAG TPA: MFS transporter [Stellaceae bacterium]|jgi:MFS family permease|nr:MFS transporter [Stellaceae bacterium]